MTLPVDRWVLTANLTALSPLSIHTGEDEVRRPRGTEPPPGHPKDGDDDATIAAIELDHLGNPFVPGSAIKGLIRALAATHLQDSDLVAIETLLGGLPKQRTQGSDSKTAWGGAAEFRNAYSATIATHAPPARGRTAIDRGSRAAAANTLRHDRAVAPGTTFDVEIIIDRAELASVKLLRSLIALVDGATPASGLGSGGALVKLDLIKVKHWDAATICSWLASDKPNWRDALYIDATRSTQAAVPAPLGKRAPFKISLQIAGHFLVSVANVARAPQSSDPNHIPIKSRSTGGERPELPDASFDGAMRAQAERIIRTVHGNPNEDWSINPPPAPMEELFGSRRMKGLFTPHNFSGSAQTPVRVDFVAIDRLSGGSSTGAKFAVKAFEAPLLSGGFDLCFSRKVSHALTGQPPGDVAQRTVSAAAIGLLALTLRDLAEGDVVLGYGTRKGFGDVDGLIFGASPLGLHPLLDAIGVAWSGGCGRTAIDGAVTAFREWGPATTAAPAEIEEVMP